MLGIFQHYYSATGEAKTQAEFASILDTAARAFGFRSAFMIQSLLADHGRLDVLEGTGERSTWPSKFLAQELIGAEYRSELQDKSVRHFFEDRLAGRDQEWVAFSRQHDLAELSLVPISRGGSLVGAVGFRGDPTLTLVQETGLVILSYLIFMRAKQAAAAASQQAAHSILSPREKDVLRLAADGLTAQQIASHLAISPRTANQYVETAASKLGTRNRTATVAEALRQGFLE